MKALNRRCQSENSGFVWKKGVDWWESWEVLDLVVEVHCWLLSHPAFNYWKDTLKWHDITQGFLCLLRWDKTYISDFGFNFVLVKIKLASKVFVSIFW